MLPRSALLAAATAAAIVLPLAVPSPSAAGPPPQALVSVYEGGVDFLPAGGHHYAILEVPGEEIAFRQTFVAGAKPAIAALIPTAGPCATGPTSGV